MDQRDSPEGTALAFKLLKPQPLLESPLFFGHALDGTGRRCPCRRTLEAVLAALLLVPAELVAGFGSADLLNSAGFLVDLPLRVAEGVEGGRFGEGRVLPPSVKRS